MSLPTRSTTPVADQLRSALLRGDYAPGQRLVEAELCESLGVGRAALREAIRLLAGDGLIEIEPHRTARVRKVSKDQALQMAEVRSVVEVLLARRAASRATPADAAELVDIGRMMRDAVEAFDPMLYSELNERLHTRIAEIADHQVAAEVVNRLQVQLTRFQMRLSLKPGRPVATLVDHEKLIEAVASGDPDAAGEAMRTHLEEVVEALGSADDLDR